MSEQINMWEMTGEKMPEDEYMELVDGKWVMKCTTGNTGEAPTKPIKSRLSDILEKNVDPKFRLSEKACLGILRRAEARGKELPKVLKDALYQTAGVTEEEIVFSKTAHPQSKDEGQGYEESDTAHTLTLFNIGEARAEELVVSPQSRFSEGEK